jgi:hypothetical protein
MAVQKCSSRQGRLQFDVKFIQKADLRGANMLAFKALTCQKINCNKT